MPFPTGAELAAYMVAQKMLAEVPQDLTALDRAAAAAATAFEGDVGWTPLLAGVAETRKFDGPGGMVLFPPVGVLSIESLKVEGVLLTEDVDFFLQDPKLGRYAFQSIEFAEWVPPTRRTIEAKGVFGLFLEVPSDVELALLSKAAAGQSTDSTSTGALKREKAGPVEREYDVSAGAVAKTSQLEAAYSGAVARYRRWV